MFIAMSIKIKLLKPLKAKKKIIYRCQHDCYTNSKKMI